ncbi:RNA polymerase sigma factor [Dactylosporangium sp. AC04546]|uniref:RNA polymerase sigma factor n=1 Tax=Dactylosporangium sp. AC04546 TaxID=2862460 RepID=UPI003FA44F96
MAPSRATPAGWSASRHCWGSRSRPLWAAVNGLPSKQRQAVVYHYVAGLAYAEIAEIVGGTVDAARRAAADGLKNLRKNYPGAFTKGASS